jgi:hypothetical protein
MMLLVLELIGPYVRILVFNVFAFLGVMASFILSQVFEEKYYTEAGLFTILTGEYQYVHAANIIVRIIQIFACIMCATKIIEIPHGTYVKPKTVADKYVWATHEAVFLIMASGIDSNDLSEKFFNNQFFVVIANDAAEASNSILFLNSESFHIIIKYVMIYSRIVCLAVGWVFIVYNLVVGGTNQFIRQPPTDPMELVALVTTTIMFFTQGVYGITHFVQLWPDSLVAVIQSIDTKQMIQERHLEFVTENLSDISLSVIGVWLTWFSSPPDNKRNALATTFLFNNVFLGFFGTAFSIKTAFATHIVKNEANTAWVPLAIFILAMVVGVVTHAITYRKTVKTTLTDNAVLFYDAVGSNYTLVSFTWKLSIAGGICALFMALLSTQAQWFTFTISAGRVPKDVAHLTGGIVQELNTLGHKGFQVIKGLDPCSWDASKGSTPTMNTNVSYTYDDTGYGKRPFTAKSEFSLQQADISATDCRCKDGTTHCSCDYINKIHADVIQKRVERQTTADAELNPVLDKYNTFQDWDENSTYMNSLQKCHRTECDIVLGVAIACETAILAGDAFSFLPFVGSLVSNAAWFGQMTNRIGNNVMMVAKMVVKILQGLWKRIEQFKPLVSLLMSLEKKLFQERYQMSLDVLIVYLPLFINGFFCTLIGFWRRENVHKVFQTYGVVVTFYIPLVLLNLSMVGLMTVFPYVIDDACTLVPNNLLFIQSKEHVGFSLLRSSYVVSTISTFILLLSTLLDDAYFLREKAGTIRKAIKQMLRWRTEAGPDAAPLLWVDRGWLQAFIISAVVPVLFALAYRYNWNFVNMKYGPSGPLLKVVSAFHSHTNMLQDIQKHHSNNKDNGLCGLIGKAVRSVTTDIIKEFDLLVESAAERMVEFVKSVTLFSEMISTFENEGRKSFRVLDESWELVEKVITLIIPLFCSTVMFIMAFVAPRLSKGKDEVERIARQIITIGIYYNIALIVMMQQLFATISNLNLHIFYFEFKSGTLVIVGFIATALNAVSLLSLYVNSIYKMD